MGNEQITTIEQALEFGIPPRHEEDLSDESPCCECGAETGPCYGGQVDYWGEGTDWYCEACTIAMAEVNRSWGEQVMANLPRPDGGGVMELDNGL